MKKINEYNNRLNLIFTSKIDEEIDKEIEKEALIKYPNKSKKIKEDSNKERDIWKNGAKWYKEKICNHNYILTSEKYHRIIKCTK